MDVGTLPKYVNLVVISALIDCLIEFCVCIVVVWRSYVFIVHNSIRYGMGMLPVLKYMDIMGQNKILPLNYDLECA